MITIGHAKILTNVKSTKRTIYVWAFARILSVRTNVHVQLVIGFAKMVDHARISMNAKLEMFAEVQMRSVQTSGAAIDAPIKIAHRAI